MQEARNNKAGQEIEGSEWDLILAPELAARLRMTPAWVYAQTRANKIPHVPLGRYVRYRRATIDAWLSDIEQGRIPAPW